MDALFLTILNMSITAGWIILAIMLLRILLKAAPKWIRCALWVLAAIRLICPRLPECRISLIPSADTITPNIIYSLTPAVNSGVTLIDRTVNPVISAFTPSPGDSVNPLQIWTRIGAVLWIVGIVCMLLYALVSYLRLYLRIRESAPLRDNIRLCDRVDSTFILGILHPHIYVPSRMVIDMKSEQFAAVIAHEKAHLKRHDHWWKPLGYLLLSIHWFNPLVWLAYILFCQDIELACDEKTVHHLSVHDKQLYSEVLLACSVKSRPLTVCPLAFGETGVKGRIKAILHTKKPAFWIIAASIILCVIAAVCLLTNPKNKSKEEITPLEGYIYVADVDEMMPARITLFDDGTFSFFFSPISSYLGTGSYTVEDNRLTLSTRDIVFTYVFDIHGNTLVFDADASSTQTWFSNLYDGAKFRKTEPINTEERIIKTDGTDD